MKLTVLVAIHLLRRTQRKSWRKPLLKKDYKPQALTSLNHTLLNFTQGHLIFVADTHAHLETLRETISMASYREPVSAAQIISPFKFLRLPLEIQYQICSLFCRHCGGPPSSPSFTLFEVADISFTTLKALSETCHALKEIAQPILYHYPDIKTYTPFFKTVATSPTLAASVKVLARLYESTWRPFRSGPARRSKEDYTYLIRLAKSFNLHDDADTDSNVDYWALDDVNFKRCFQFLDDSDDGDQEGNTLDLALQAYSSLLTALHFAILPQLEFAMIDLYDGRCSLRSSLPKSGQLMLSYPYLPKIVAAKPDHFLHLDTIVFRRTYHYRGNSLGLERIAFLLPAIPNVRVVFFDRLHGEKPGRYQELSQPPPPGPELTWPALTRLEEIYFDPCARPKNSIPLEAFSNMLQRCPKLTKLVYRHKYPDQYKPTVLFSPAALLNSILPYIKKRLQHLELYCSAAKIPSFPIDTLLGFRMKEFTVLSTLVLDEELFCQHWLSDSSQDSCLVNILPETVSSLTVRLHDKFKAVPDIERLGRQVASGYYSKLSRLQVHVLHDREEIEDTWNANQDPDAFDSEYLLHSVPEEQWETTLRELAESIRLTVTEAFRDAEVAVEVKYVFEISFSDARAPADIEYLY